MARPKTPISGESDVKTACSYLLRKLEDQDFIARTPKLNDVPQIKAELAAGVAEKRLNEICSLLSPKDYLRLRAAISVKNHAARKKDADVSVRVKVSTHNKLLKLQGKPPTKTLSDVIDNLIDSQPSEKPDR